MTTEKKRMELKAVFSEVFKTLFLISAGLFILIFVLVALALLCVYFGFAVVG